MERTMTRSERCGLVFILTALASCSSSSGSTPPGGSGFGATGGAGASGDGGPVGGTGGTAGGTGGTAGNLGTPCANSFDCTGGLVCNGISCVECVTNDECTAPEMCVDNSCQPTCTSDTDCLPMGQLCNMQRNICVDCITDADCAQGKCIGDSCKLPDGIACGGDTCTIQSENCCLYQSSSTCLDTGTSCGLETVKLIECDGAEDCAAGQVCCLSTKVSCVGANGGCRDSGFTPRQLVCKPDDRGFCPPPLRCQRSMFGDLWSCQEG